MFVFSSKRAADVAPRAQPQTLARNAKAVEVRSQTSEGDLRHQMNVDDDMGDVGPTKRTGSAGRPESAGVQSYKQWARFTLAASSGDSGPSFEDKGSPAEYTWTPALGS